MLGSERVETVLTLANPSAQGSLSANLDLIDQVPGPVLIDEWRLVPVVWDRVRRAVDDDPTGGRYLLQGGIDEVHGATDVDLAAYTDEILRSGFPGIRDLPERVRQLQLRRERLEYRYDGG